VDPVGSEARMIEINGSNTIPSEIIQKKIVSGKVVDVVKNIPDELKPKGTNTIPEEFKAKPKANKNDKGTEK